MSRHGRKPMSQINVVPLIDVMLLLLIIFMVTAPMIRPGNIDLPSVGESLSPDVAPIEVDIKANQTLVLRNHAANDGNMESVTDASLAQAVSAIQSSHPGQAVVIAADRHVRYEVVLKVMDILRQAGVTKIGLLAKSKAG
ncbi:MAG: ExbD/TolR family protein [Proteobacteria bacterium]|nr:ExbD/TolR family protein [Pseudomonadota bacterium]MDE3207584.1 ExbD/TolR family protein [Pseudomonadota bacterium]